MRLNTYAGGGLTEGATITIDGMTLTGPLVIESEITESNQAVHKLYVDSATEGLNAANITSGTILAARLPGMGGDVTVNSGNSNVVLKPTGVVAGTYSKVTVDQKGRVTGSSNITESDIPNLNWNKITSDKPTTLEGYGIEGSLAKEGGVVTGTITLAGAPLDNEDVATKAYVDSKISSSVGGSFKTGDIVGFPVATPPSGFLRCNGGALSKTTYSTLYGIIGDIFTNQGTIADRGKPWALQYDFNYSNSAISSVNPSTFQTSNISEGSSVIVTKNRVYLIAGTSGNIIESNTINSSGLLEVKRTNTVSNLLPYAFSFAQAIVVNNRVHIMGGFLSSGALNTVITAPINADGTLGTWSYGNNLPGGLKNSQAVLIKNRVYLIGGRDATTTTNVVYFATVNSDGTLGAWSTGTPLPAAIGNAQLVATKDRLYLMGGQTGSTAISTIYTCVINEDSTLGTWSVAGNLPIALYDSASVVINSKIYLFGGTNSAGSHISTIYVIDLDINGVITTSGASGVTLQNNSRHTVFITSSRLYIAHGTDGSRDIHDITFTGGYNDYSSFYDGLVVPIDPLTQFLIPDFTGLENTNLNKNLYYYIKT